MKFMRFAAAVGKEKPELMETNAGHQDLSSRLQDWNAAFFANNGPTNLAALRDTDMETSPVVPETERRRYPMVPPEKIVCILSPDSSCVIRSEVILSGLDFENRTAVTHR